MSDTQFIIVSGSRDWTNEPSIRETLSRERSGQNVCLIHGDCRGADRLAASIAREFGWRVIAQPANWNKHGRAAGPIRNSEMIRDWKKQNPIVFAFHENLEQSRGTKDLVKKAKRAGLCVTNVTE